MMLRFDADDPQRCQAGPQQACQAGEAKEFPRAGLVLEHVTGLVGGPAPLAAVAIRVNDDEQIHGGNSFRYPNRRETRSGQPLAAGSQGVDHELARLTY